MTQNLDLKPQQSPLPSENRDRYWLSQALQLGQKAAHLKEVPVGALIVNSATQTIISKAYNLREKLQSPLGHAELLAIHRASKALGSWRLTGHTLYVTLEPCLMCAGAILQSRMDRVVFGALDPKGGATHSLYQVLSDSRLNHQVSCSGPLLEKECGLLLKKFFRELRKHKKIPRSNNKFKKSNN